MAHKIILEQVQSLPRNPDPARMAGFLNGMGPALHNFYDQKQLQNRHMERFADLMQKVGYDLRNRSLAPTPPDQRDWENFVAKLRSECMAETQGGGWGNRGGDNSGRGGGSANNNRSGRRYDDRNDNRNGRRFDDRNDNRNGRRYDDRNDNRNGRRYDDRNDNRNGRRYDRGYDDSRKRGRNGRQDSGRRGGRQFTATAEEVKNNRDSPIQLMRTAFALSWKDSEHQKKVVQYRIDINIFDSATEAYVPDIQVWDHSGLCKKLFHMAMEKVKERKGEGFMESSMRIVDTMSFMSKMDPKAMRAVSDPDPEGVQTPDLNDPVKKGDIAARFYVELQPRAHDPRNDDDSDGESKEEKEAQPVKKYQISLKFARLGIEDTDPDMISTFTRLFRKAIPADRYISTMYPGVFFKKSDMEILMNGQGNQRLPDTIEYLGRKGLTLIRGWKATVGRTAEKGMYVTVDLANGYLQRNSIEEAMESELQQQINGRIDDAKRLQIEESFVGKFVVTVYNGRKYKIDGIDWETTAGSPMPPAIQDKFKKKNNLQEDQTISYIDYVATLYNVDRRKINANAPLLISTIRRRAGESQVLLVPSLCHKIGLTSEQDSDGQLRREMCTTCKMGPEKRLNFISKFVRELSNIMQSESLLTLDTKPLVQTGTLLKKSLIEFQDTTKYFPDDRHSWRNAQKDKSLSTSGTLRFPNFAVVSANRDLRAMENFVDKMNEVAEPMNVAFGRPTWITAYGNQQSDFIQAYRKEMARRGHSNGFDMVLVKLPHHKKAPVAIYNSIKGELTFGEYSCPNQIVTSAADGNLSKVTGVVAQMAGPKKSNKLWSVVDVDELCKVLCPKGEEPLPIVMALDQFQKMSCLTFTTEANMVNVQCAFHHRSDDDGENVYRSLLIDAFNRFAEANGGKPPNGMLLYLVGTSDSRIDKRRQHAQEMQSFVNEYYESKEWQVKPQMEFVQINLSAAKLFDAAGRDNAPPGSMMDISTDETM